MKVRRRLALDSSVIPEAKERNSYTIDDLLLASNLVPLGAADHESRSGSGPSTSVRSRSSSSRQSSGSMYNDRGCSMLPYAYPYVPHQNLSSSRLENSLAYLTKSFMNMLMNSMHKVLSVKIHRL